MANKFNKGVLATSNWHFFIAAALTARCKDYWKERLKEEQAEIVKQSKQYWDCQTRITLGFY